MEQQALAISLAALRLAPTFAFAPPFTMIRVPAMVRGAFVIALAATAVGLSPAAAPTLWRGGFAVAALSELTVGLAMALALQLTFAMISTAGRMLDIQAGFGLAFLIDPTTKAQMPLIGALFGYFAAAVFFATDGPANVLATLAASFRILPLGGALSTGAVPHLVAFLGTISILALGVTGLASTVMLAIDLVIAMMSRSLPQMNMLVFGFQVKAMVTLLILPATLGLAASVIATMLRLAIEAMQGMV